MFLIFPYKCTYITINSQHQDIKYNSTLRKHEIKFPLSLHQCVQRLLPAVTAKRSQIMICKFVSINNPDVRSAATGGRRKKCNPNGQQEEESQECES